MPEKICTNSRDRNGRTIWTGDTVINEDGFSGPVVFSNCAFRVDVSDDQNGCYLRYNSSLLFREGVGTGGWEVI
ncbi:hypothetical protein [Desulfocastanea catecholica]